MLYITILTFLLLIGFLAFQRYTILKYKELSVNEKSFIASLTHDLKSPTYAQINMLNLLLKGYFGKLNPQQYEVIKLTCTSNKYISNLIGTVLAGYKYEKPAIFLNKKYFDIIETINEILIENKCLISDKNLQIDFNHKNTECYIFADELQIKRVIINLLSNAINYSIPKTCIFMKINQNDKYTEFSISNKSNPLTGSEIKNIFNKYTKSPNSMQNKNSTGLGLYTAKKIINQHNGKINAEYTPDGYFTICFKLKQITLQKSKQVELSK